MNSGHSVINNALQRQHRCRTAPISQSRTNKQSPLQMYSVRYRPPNCLGTPLWTRAALHILLRNRQASGILQASGCARGLHCTCCEKRTGFQCTSGIGVCKWCVSFSFLHFLSFSLSVHTSYLARDMDLGPELPPLPFSFRTRATTRKRFLFWEISFFHSSFPFRETF